MAGTFAPFGPQLAHSTTGKLHPSFVPACAFRHIGSSTIVFPSSTVIIACHHVIPASIIAPAIMYVLMTTLIPIQRAAMFQVFQVRRAIVVGARSGFQSGDEETSS